MLNAPKTPDRDRLGGKKDAERNSSSEFIQELAEAGTANELGIVKAASDAVDEKEGEVQRKRRARDERSAKK